MALARDPHYLPTLRRYERSPRSGCGFLSLSDCYDCIRGDVREALDAIERANPGALPDPDDETARGSEGRVVLCRAARPDPHEGTRRDRLDG